MASPGIVGFRHREAAFALAAVLLLGGLLATLLISGGIPAVHAGGPVLIASTSTTNVGGEVDITGTGWAPATHYNLYVYGQAKCKPNPTCPPPSPSDPYLINSTPQPIDSQGNFGPFSFTFRKDAGITTYVFTVIADYPTTNPYTASVLVQVVPLGTPPSGIPVSSSPTPATPTTTPTSAAASPTATSQAGGSPGGQTTGTGGANTLAIIVVTVLLLIAIAILTGLLIVLPPKRRAIRAAWYGASGAGSTGGRRYGASGPSSTVARRSSGGYPSLGEPEPPAWMGGVAQWDDQPPSPRGSPSRPRRPSRSDY